MAFQRAKWGLSELKCALSVNYTLGYEDLLRKKVKILHS